MNIPAPDETPDSGPDVDLRAYLRGSWSVDRTLLDRSSGARGTFTGVVRFTDNADGGLNWREEGTVRWSSGSGAPFSGPASREYVLRPADTPAVLDVYFPDGRPFHRMGFAGQSSQDVHWCDPDTYRVTYTALGPDECGYRWDVTGPAKDQLLESSLRRLDPAAAADPAPETDTETETDTDTRPAG